MEEGNYFYYLNKEKILIGKNNDGTNYIKMNNTNDILLYKMIFNKGYFFAKNTGIICKTNTDYSNQYKRFDMLYSTGHSNTYVKLENHF